MIDYQTTIAIGFASGIGSAIGTYLANKHLMPRAEKAINKVQTIKKWLEK